MCVRDRERQIDNRRDHVRVMQEIQYSHLNLPKVWGAVGLLGFGVLFQLNKCAKARAKSGSGSELAQFTGVFRSRNWARVPIADQISQVHGRVVVC